MSSLFIISSNVFAIDFRVLHKSGISYKVTEQEQKVPLQKHMKIYPGDTIATTSNAFVVLKGENFSIHRVEENTTIKITQLPSYYEDSDQIDKEGIFEIVKGTIFNEIERKHNTESFRVKTKSVSMGVRGTQFFVNKGAEDNDVMVGVESGEVAVENNYSNALEYIDKNEVMLIEKDFNFTAKQKLGELTNKQDWDLKNTVEGRKFKERRQQIIGKVRKQRQKWIPNKERIKKKVDLWKNKLKKNSKKIKRLMQKKKLKLDLKSKEKEQVKKKIKNIQSDIKRKRTMQESTKKLRRRKQRLKKKILNPPGSD